MAFLTQNKAELWKNLIIALVFEENEIENPIADFCLKFFCYQTFPSCCHKSSVAETRQMWLFVLRQEHSTNIIYISAPFALAPH
jgi:hypothetical protein